MFIDWLKITQDFKRELPLVSENSYKNVYIQTGECSDTKQPTIKHEGSFSTFITIKITGSTITMDGNPSKYGRLDNVIGFTSLENCVNLYNEILSSLGLPVFTKCTRLLMGQTSEDKKTTIYSDGAIIKRVDLCSMVTTGGHADDYIKALSTQPYRHLIPRLHTNGKTCDWLSKSGNARLIYAKVYDKSNEINLRALPSAKRQYGANSNEYLYLKELSENLSFNGVVRFETGLRYELLKQKNNQFYGLHCMEELKEPIRQLMSLDERIKVTKMDMHTIADTLINEGVCKDYRAANTSAFYVFNWMHGQTFDFSKRQVQEHRARLRRIGIDIKYACDVTRFSPVKISKSIEINKGEFVAPSFYKPIKYLKVA